MSQHPFFPTGFPLWVGFWLLIYFFLNKLEKRKERFPLRSPWFREEECSWSREGAVEGQSKSWSGFQLLSVGNQPEREDEDHTPTPRGVSLTWVWKHQPLKSPCISLEEGNGNSVQYSCLKNFMDRGTWQVWCDKESDTTEQFSLTHLHFPLRVWNSLTFLVKFILPSTVIALHLTVKNPTLIRAVFLFYTKWIF